MDFLYRDEFAVWEGEVDVSVRPAFSTAPVDGVKYVQDRLWADRAEVTSLVERGAVFFVCGDGRRLEPAVHDTCTRSTDATGASAEQADAWLTEMQREHGRSIADVIA